VDKHTFLANKPLGLSSYLVNTKWPKTLLKHGYQIHDIELTVNVKGGNVSPDIILTNSGTDHVLVIDCKSGANIDQEQDARYGQITTNDLRRAGVPSHVRSHAPIYAINEEHVGRIRGHTDHSLLVFGSRRIYGIGDFGDADLDVELHNGVPLEDDAAPDTDIYPFSIRDTPAHIDTRVSRAVLRHLAGRPGMAGRSLATRAAAGAILREAHPLHLHFSGPHRRELRRAVERSIERQEARGAWWLGPGARRAIGL